MGSRCNLAELTQDKSVCEVVCADAEGTAPGVSVILFEDTLHQGQLIAETRNWFRQQSTPVEFFVVSSCGTKMTPLSGSGHATSVRSIEAAIRISNYELIATADSVYQFKGLHWNVIEPGQQPQAIRSFSFAPLLAPGSRRIITWLYCLVLRLLLKVRKNRITPGVVTFPKSLLQSIDLHRIDSEDPDGVSQLMSLAKARGIPVEEHRCSNRQAGTVWTKSNSGGPHFPKSKSLKSSIKRACQFWFGELAFPSRHSGARRSKTSKRHRLATSCLILLVAAILLFSNSGHPLFEPDETRNAQLALNIVDSGNWTSLSLFGEPYWDKPPLLAWLTATSYRCFGVSEWSTRLPSQISSLLLIAFLLNAGSKLIGFRAVAIGSTALLLAWGFAFQSRYVTMDALLMLFTTATTLGIAVGVHGDNQSGWRTRWLLASGVALGLGILAKGPICLVLVVPPVAAWLFLNRDVKSDAVSAAFKLVSLPAIAVSAPWFILTTIREPQFAWHFLWKHHVVRFSDAFNHEEPFWYYAPIIWLFMFPASILLPRVIQVMVSQKEKYRSTRTPTHALLFLSTIWIVGFFSLSQCKLPAYVLPAFPMIALLIGSVLDTDLSRVSTTRGRLERLPKRIAIGICILSCVAAGLSLHFGSRDLVDKLFAGTIVLISVALAVQFPLKRSTSRKKSWLATAAICMLFVLSGVNHLVPSIAKDRSILHAIATDGSNDSNPVVYFGRDSFAAGIYLPNRPVVQFDEESLSQLEDFLQENPEASLVTSDENMAKVKESFGSNASLEKSQARHTWNISVGNGRVASESANRKTR